jgi:DNA primase
MKHDGLSFPEAVKSLARRYGIEIPTPRMSPEQKRRMSEREKLLQVNRTVVEFYQRNLLNGASGKKAREYLEKRGLGQDIIQEFNLGYAPEGWDNLLRFSQNKRIRLDVLEKSGLIVPRKNRNGFYDRFRDRIIFPIFDLSAQVVGFGGRVMDDGLPKYLNSPETPVFNKRRSLYGLHRARQKCRKTGVVYIVEGYFDQLTLYRHGFQNAVATLGTALTPEHAQMLRGFVGNSGEALLVYDSDAAGIKAAERSIGIFNKAHVDARILVLPEGYDPDSYLLEFGADAFTRVASGARGIMPFLIDSAVNRHGLSIEGKVRIINDLEQPLAAIRENITRSLYVKELAERIGIDETAVLEKVRERSAQLGAGSVVKSTGRGSLGPDRRTSAARQEPLCKRAGRLERQIIAMMIQFSEILTEIETRDVLALFEDDALKTIGQRILEYGGCEGGKVSDLISSVDDREERRIIAALAIGEDMWDREGCLKLISQFETSRRRHRKTLIDRIKAAERQNDHELLVKLLNEKQKLAVMNEKQKTAFLNKY